MTATGGSDLIPTVASAMTLTLGPSLVIADNGTAVGLTKAGIGRLALTGTANTFTGAVYLNEGDLQIAANGSLGTGTVINFDGGSLSLVSGITISRPINLGPGGGQIGVIGGATGTFSGNITGSGVFTFINNYQASGFAVFRHAERHRKQPQLHAGGLETNDGLNTSGASVGQSTGNPNSVLNVTGDKDTFGHLRIDGSTVNLNSNSNPDPYTITGDLVMSAGTLNLFGTNTMTGTTGTSTGAEHFRGGRRHCPAKRRRSGRGHFLRCHGARRLHQLHDHQPGPLGHWHCGLDHAQRVQPDDQRAQRQRRLLH